MPDPAPEMAAPALPCVPAVVDVDDDDDDDDDDELDEELDEFGELEDDEPAEIELLEESEAPPAPPPRNPCAPPRVPPSLGASSETDFTAAVVPVNLSILSTLPVRALTVRTPALTSALAPDGACEWACQYRPEAPSRATAVISPAQRPNPRP